MSKSNKFFSKLKALLNKGWDFLFPDNLECIFCNAEIKNKNEFCCCEKCFDEFLQGRKVCLKCGDSISHKGNYCLACKKEICLNYEFARAPFEYVGNVKTIVQNLKYSNGKWLAKYMAAFLAQEYENMNLETDVIIPVPMHKQKLKIRGYNQTELLAKELSAKINVAYSFNNLIKTRETTTQTKLNKAERLENLAGSFEVVNREEIVNKNILLIDDVFTTGATIEETSKILKFAGANKIYVLTFAHTPHPIKFEK